MNRVLPSCKDVSELTSRAMDESLPWRKRLGLKLHLKICIWCRRNAEQFRLMRQMAHSLPVETEDKARLSSAARRKIAESLEKSDDHQ